VSFVLPSRGFVGVLGSSGSGKSTLLSLLSLLEKPSEGKILFFGKEVTAFSEKEKEDFRALHFGFVFQHFNLLEEESALFNVELPLLLRGLRKEEAESQAKSLFAAFGMGGLEKKKGKILSGGEKQRVALLRAALGDPEVLFADEPSGALDPLNEERVFQFLKEASATRLVVVVSHNAKLLRRYAEKLLMIQEGKLSLEEGGLPPFEKKLNKKKRGRHSDWLSSLFLSHFRAHRKRNFLSLGAAWLAFSSLLAIAGFYFGSRATLGEEENRNLGYAEASLSKKESYPIAGSPLSLSKQTRPTLSEGEALLSHVPGVSLHPDYSYFFPNYNAYSLNGEKEEGASFIPLWDLSLRNRSLSFDYQGQLPSGNSLEEVVVNESFASLFSESPLHKSITLSLSNLIEEGEVQDSLSFSLSFYIVAVVKEFSFLSTPKVYYSYSAFSSLLHECELVNLSKARGKEVTLDAFLEERKADDPYLSYAYHVYAHDEKAADRLKAFSQSLKEEKSPYALTSDVYEIAAAFSSLSSAFSASLLPFLLLVFLGAGFIVASLSYASFLSEKKEAATLWALGARRKESDSLYLLESLLDSLGGAFVSWLAAYPLEKLGSFLLEKKLGIKNLIQIPLLGKGEYPWLCEIVLLLLAAGLALLGSGLPLGVSHRKSLGEELRDE
jgi:ABC-type lipoprotein export system ATPase subunit